MFNFFEPVKDEVLFSELLNEAKLSEHAEIKKDAVITGFSPITSADMFEKCCVFLLDKSYADHIAKSVSMVITNEENYADLCSGAYGICITAEPRGLYFELLDAFERRHPVRQQTKIGKNCQIANSARISDINVVIGDNVIIGENVKIEPGTSIADYAIINDDCVIGSQNYLLYSFAGKNKQVNSRGSTYIGENTIILHDTIIGRAAYDYDSTIIGNRCKIGKRVDLGHNSRIGNGVSIYSGCLIAGNVYIDDNVSIYTGSTIVNRIHIGANATINAGSVVMKDVPENEKWMGNPARKMPI